MRTIWAFVRGLASNASELLLKTAVLGVFSLKMSELFLKISHVGLVFKASELYLKTNHIGLDSLQKLQNYFLKQAMTRLLKGIYFKIVRITFKNKPLIYLRGFSLKASELPLKTTSWDSL